MGADRQPDHVWLSGPNLFPVGEDRSPIRRPGHLEATRHPHYALDPEPGPELPRPEVGDEVLNRSLEGGTLLGRETPVLAPEPLGRLVGGQRRR